MSKFVYTDDDTDHWPQILRTYFSAEPSDLLYFLRSRSCGRASFGCRLLWKLQVLAGADVEAGYGHVVHPHSVRYGVVVARVRITERRRRSASDGRRSFQYAPNRGTGAVPDRTVSVVHALVELDALADDRRWQRLLGPTGNHVFLV